MNIPQIIKTLIEIYNGSKKTAQTKPRFNPTKNIFKPDKDHLRIYLYFFKMQIWTKIIDEQYKTRILMCNGELHLLGNLRNQYRLKL